MNKVLKIFTMVLILVGMTTIVFANTQVNVEVNGELIDFDVKPYIDENNRTLVPVRFISEKLGAGVEWLKETREVVITKDDRVITLKIDDDKVKVNDEVITLDTAASFLDGRTFVPVRFVSKALGAKAEWDRETRTVFITDGGQATTVDEYGMTDEEFEEFINGEEGAKVASTGFFTAEDGKLIFHSQGIYSGYKNEEVNNSHFTEINDLAYDLVKYLSLYSKKNGGAVSVKYNDLNSGAILIDYVETIEVANNKKATVGSFRITLLERPMNDEFTHVVIELGKMWDRKTLDESGADYIREKAYKTEKCINAYKEALKALYKDKEVATNLFQETIREYDKKNSGDHTPNTDTKILGDIELKTWNEDGYTLLFTINH